jgi:hypothetical protein
MNPPPISLVAKGGWTWPFTSKTRVLLSLFSGMWALFGWFLYVLQFLPLDTCAVLAIVQWNICKNHIENRISSYSITIIGSVCVVDFWLGYIGLLLCVHCWVETQHNHSYVPPRLHMTFITISNSIREIVMQIVSDAEVIIQGLHILQV